MSNSFRQLSSTALLSLSILFTLGCEPESEPTGLSNPYLGQDPPGMEPVRFPPEGYRATAEWFWHGSPAFSADGEEMYFAQMTPSGGLWLRYTRVVDGDWIPHEDPSFASEDAENNPMFAVDDPNRIYFISQREYQADNGEDSNTRCQFPVEYLFHYVLLILGISFSG